MGYKVFLPQDIAKAGKDYLLEQGHEIVFGSGISQELMIKEIADCDAVVSRTAKYTRAVLEAAPKLKVVSGYGVGADNIDLPCADELGIWVTTNPTVNVSTVAECTIGQILSLSRCFGQFERALRAGDFAIKTRLQGEELEGKTLGLLGLGNIGRLVASKAINGFGMKVQAYDPYVKMESVPQDIEMISDWETIFSSSDFVSLHMPFTGKKMVGMKEFKLMKPTAYFLNSSRGAIVYEDELIEALQKGIIAGAGLDVFEKEPIDPDNPLVKMENVILTPHIAGLTKQSEARMSLQAATQINAVLSGNRPEFPKNSPVNPRNVR